MNDRTPLPQQEIPGWYIKLQADVLSQLPRLKDGMDKITAERWTKNNGAGLKKFLNGLVVPPKIELLNKRFSIFETFDVYFDEIVVKKYCDQNFLKSNSFLDLAKKFRQNQKIKVDVILARDNVSVADCLDFLLSENALLLGELGCRMVVEQQVECCKKNIHFPLTDRWTASFGEDTVDLLGKDFHIHGIKSCDFVNYDLVIKSSKQLIEENILFFLCFRNAFE